MHHAGHHHHDSENASTKRLAFVTALTLTIFVAELIGGIVSSSLALVADAGHMLTDAAGLILALVAAAIGGRTATERATYGYRRIEVLTGLVNGVSIIVIGIIIA